MYIRVISSRGGKLGAAALATAALALLALTSPADTKRLPVTVRLVSAHHAELLAAGAVPVRLRSGRGGRVRIMAQLRFRARRPLVLGSARGVRLPPGRSRRVAVPLRPAARAALKDCPAARLVVTVRRRNRSRSASAPLRGDPPDCGRFFDRNTFWNTPLADDAPLDPDSAEITAHLLSHVRSGFDSGLKPTINTTHYTPPVHTVGSRQRRVRVRLDRPPGYAPELEAAFASVPLPEEAIPAQGMDSELVVWQPATDTLWEFWALKRSGDGWHASWGGRMKRVSSGPGVYTAPHANWGATATSLPHVGGLITPRELRKGRIDHALAVGVPRPRAGVFARPAQRTDGFSHCPHSVPEGARFRLDPTLDIDALRLPRAVATLARAVQRYGMLVRDHSDAVSFYAQNASSLGADPYPALFGGSAPWDLLRRFPWTRLQLVRMELVEMPGERAPVPPPEAFIGCR